jgi:hypothetical protein
MTYYESATLLKEAKLLAERINRARLEGIPPADYHTIRLCEIIDILTDREDKTA